MNPSEVTSAAGRAQTPVAGTLTTEAVLLLRAIADRLESGRAGAPAGNAPPATPGPPAPPAGRIGAVALKSAVAGAVTVLGEALQGAREGWLAAAAAAGQGRGPRARPPAQRPRRASAPGDR